MSLETEAVLDRRRLRRSLTLWRSLAIIAFVAAIGTLVAIGTGGVAPRTHIARVSVEGMITEDRDRLRLLTELAESKAVEGVIVFVNSPGGTLTGGEALFQGLRQLAEKKPVIAQFGTVAASAAYIAGLGADHIVARGGTITGSVGVIMQWPEVTELLAKVGVRMNELKSGPLKAAPSPFKPMDEASRAAAEKIITDGQRWFLGLVSARRNIRTGEIDGLEQGRVYSGREARDLKLVDELGGETEAVKWLEEKRKVTKGLKVVDWKPRRAGSWPVPGLLAAAAAGLAGETGRGLGALVAQEPALATLGLDGLVSVWHPGKM
jgi:protease-4